MLPLTLVVGYDGSESAQRALDRAASLTGYGSLLIVAAVATDERGLERASELLDEAESRLLLQRVLCRKRELVGKPAEELISLAAESIRCSRSRSSSWSQTRSTANPGRACK
jgi:hypothetical protein